MSLSEQVAALIEVRNSINAELTPLMASLKDTSIPLDERWSAYELLVANDILVNNETYGDGFIDILGGDLTQYDHFHNDRGATVDFVDMYERILEAGEWSKALVAVRDSGTLPAWQEAVLASGYSSFTYDW